MPNVKRDHLKVVPWSPSFGLRSMMEVIGLFCFEPPVEVTVRSHTKSHVLLKRKKRKICRFSEKPYFKISIKS